MTGTFRGVDGVRKLLKIARNEAETLRVDLVDIENAKLAANSALGEIADSVAREEASAGADPTFNVYAEAMRERRFNLRKTLASLDAAEEQAREKLQAALTEIAKLEHLVEINERQENLHRQRKDARKAAEAPPVRVIAS